MSIVTNSTFRLHWKLDRNTPMWFVPESIRVFRVSDDDFVLLDRQHFPLKMEMKLTFIKDANDLAGADIV